MAKRLLTNTFILMMILLGFFLVTKVSKKGYFEKDHHILSDLLHQAPVVYFPGLSSKEEIEDSSSRILENSYGKPLLVNFGASWCESCQGEKEELRKVAEKYQKDGLKIIGIASHDKKQDLLLSDYLKDKPYPVLFDEKGNTCRYVISQSLICCIVLLCMSSVSVGNPAIMSAPNTVSGLIFWILSQNLTASDV